MAEVWSLTVTIINGRKVSVSVPKDCYVRELREKVKQASDSSGEIHLFFEGTAISDEPRTRLSDYCIMNGHVLTAKQDPEQMAPSTLGVPAAGALMTLYLKLTGEKTVAINVPANATPQQLYAEAGKHINVNEGTRLLFQGKEVLQEAGRRIVDYGIEACATVSVLQRVVGGC